jgi:ketopantoate reductase
MQHAEINTKVFPNAMTKCLPIAKKKKKKFIPNFWDTFMRKYLDRMLCQRENYLSMIQDIFNIW